MNFVDANKRLDWLQRRTLLPLSLISFAGFGVAAMIGIVEMGGSPGIVESVLALAVVGNLFYFLQSNNAALSTQILIGLVGVFLSAGAYSGMAERIGFYWIVFFPVLATLLLGRIIASIFSVFLILSLVPTLLLDETLDFAYSSADIAGVLVALLVSQTILFIYDSMLRSHELKQDVINDEEDPEKHLRTEIAQRQNAEAQMAEALRKLEENNSKLEQITAIDEATIASIGEAVLIVDQDGIIIRANPSSGRVLGVNQEDLIGIHISEKLSFALQKSDDQPLQEEDLVIHQSIIHRSIDVETYRITQPSGTAIYAQMTSSPLVVGGEVYGAVCVVRDVTQEVVVDQAKSEFVSIASHQLRTPLSTINWYLEMVLSGDFGDITEDQKEFIGEAYDASKRMGDLINALLNASRLDVGVVAVEPVPDVDIRDVLKGVMSDLESRVAEKHISMEAQIDDSVVPMPLDTRIMEIIFLNLLTNAVKYSDSDSSVIVSAFTDEENLVISVTDHGFGIPENVQDKIFTKMFRAENAVEHVPDGNGLGLYIIKSIVDTIGGSISFVSKENEGTTFTVRIPKQGMAIRQGAKQLSLDPNLN